MTIQEIIAAAPTSNTWQGELTNGKTEAILSFGTRKGLDAVRKELKAAGATIVEAKRTEYGQYLLQVQWIA